MPLNENNQRTFHRTLYATQLQSVTFNKRNDDQKEGTVTQYRLHEIRWSQSRKSGQPLRGDMATKYYRTIHIPHIQLDCIGVHYINVLDSFVDREGAVWQPETDEMIHVKLFRVHVCVDCRMIKGEEKHG